MEFEFHDEGGAPWAAALLGDWLVQAGSRLHSHLGKEPTQGAIHVVLSDRESHERRFPPREDEARLLLPDVDLDSFGQDRGPGAEALKTYRWSSYAHGVATCAADWQSPPESIPSGDPVIYLDVTTIEALAEELSVPPESMLARVATHELVHIFRGHANESQRATHGWLHEGDAQRDAWEVLTATLANASWEGVARWGRTAQVRLAERQPPAYRVFGDGWADRRMLVEHDPVAASPHGSSSLPEQCSSSRGFHLSRFPSEAPGRHRSSATTSCFPTKP